MLIMGNGRTFGAQEFAELAGVTVRALHHYDRLGLLKPERTDSGYRVYRDFDLQRLEQIVALKFIGVPLRKIAGLLGSDGPALRNALRSQRRVLKEKKCLLDAALQAIGEAELALERGTQPGASILKTIIEVMQMHDSPDWMMKYFSDESKPKIQERKEAWTPELQAQAEQNWSDLFRDIRLALDEDPASAKAQTFVDRWNELMKAFTGNDPQLAGGVKALYADRANWPANFHEKMQPFTDERVWDFFRRAVIARRQMESRD